MNNNFPFGSPHYTVHFDGIRQITPQNPDIAPTFYGIITDNKVQQAVLHDLIAERRYQHTRWGGAPFDHEHSPATWADFVRDYHARANAAMADGAMDFAAYRRNLVKTAALLVAQIEALDATLAPPS